MNDSALPLEGRLTCTIAEAMAATGLSHSTFARLLVDKRLETVKIGKRRLIRVASLLELLAAGTAPRHGRLGRRATP